MSGDVPDLARSELPRSSRYPAGFQLDDRMGPNGLWLAERLRGTLPLSPASRVLDLGCGRALRSVFLAREDEARVHAVDLWMDPDRSFQRIAEAGVADLVCPMRAER